MTGDPNILFVVFRVGVYRHECGGVFSTYHTAEHAASELIHGEPDEHHGYEIVPFYLNEITPRAVGVSYGFLRENKPLLKLQRYKGKVMVYEGIVASHEHVLSP